MRSSNCLVVLLCVVVSCVPADDEQFAIFSESYNFELSAWGWEAGFTDYPVDDAPQSDSIYLWDAGPAPLSDGNSMALRLTCQNNSGDVFMYIKRKISGLYPNTTYFLAYSVRLQTEAPNDSPLILKAGASFVEPQKIVQSGRYELNLDKGGNTQSGKDLFVLGQTGLPSAGHGYVYSSFNNAGAPRRFSVRSNHMGEVWLIVGTESGSEGINTIYYKEIQVIFSASE